MALCVRSSASCKAAAAPRRVQRAAVRPVAALKQQDAVKVASVAGVALAAGFAAAPAEAANLITTVASAAEGYPFVPPEWAPAVLIPLVAWGLPLFAMASLFVYIEKDA